MKRTPTQEYKINDVIRSMGENLRRGEGAYFLGSGISKPSGLPDWLGLLKDIATPLGLDVQKDDDLPMIAQYCINADNGNRGPILGRLQRALSATAKPNHYHDAVAKTNLDTIWTTNYDTLLEGTLGPSRVAIRANDADLSSGTREVDVEILKMHGCIDRSGPEEIVIAKEDYEDFPVRRPAFAARLQHDLLNRSFLFVGYSYRDPNIETIIVEARRLSRKATREHYFITVLDEDQRERRLQELWHDDLKRFGIRTVFIKDYDELSQALRRLSKASRGKSVFVTGSHESGSKLAEELGSQLANIEGVVFLDGQSQGTGRSAANAFGIACLGRSEDLRSRTRFFPNPYAFNPDFSNDPDLLGTLKQWRSSLARAAHTFVVFDGGMGTKAEVEVAREFGCVIVPVPGNPDGLGKALLEEDAIKQTLDAGYVEKAQSGRLEAADIAQCVEATFDA